MHPNAPARTPVLFVGTLKHPPLGHPHRLLAPALLLLSAVFCGPLWASDPAPTGRAASATKEHPPVPAKDAGKGAGKGAVSGAAPGQQPAPATGKAPATGPQVAIAPVRAGAGSDDPIEHLRLRLSERLNTAKPDTQAAGPLEVRVLAKAPPAHGGGKGHSGGKARNAHKGASEHVAHWAYSGPAGPQTWGGLKPEFSLCATGQRQSPIDIQGGLPVELEPVQFHYKASRFAVVDNGHTVQANLAAGNSIEVGGKRFELKQFHFHRPSEERIDGRQFDMSLHLVHQDEQGRLAVVGLLLDRGAPHPTVQKVWNNLPLEKQQEQPARVLLELNELLPSNPNYYTYMGSLTTPPCSEGVQWIVMRQPVSVSAEQIELFSRLYPMNARPVQQVAGRRILQTP